MPWFTEIKLGRQWLDLTDEMGKQKSDAACMSEIGKQSTEIWLFSSEFIPVDNTVVTVAPFLLVLGWIWISVSLRHKFEYLDGC